MTGMTAGFKKIAGIHTIPAIFCEIMHRESIREPLSKQDRLGSLIPSAPGLMWPG